MLGSWRDCDRQRLQIELDEALRREERLLAAMEARIRTTEQPSRRLSEAQLATEQALASAATLQSLRETAESAAAACLEDVERRDRTIAQLAGVIGQKDAAIARLAKVIEERDRTVADLTAAVAVRDEHLIELIASTEAREQTMAELRDVIAKRDDELALLATAVGTRDDEIIALRDRVDAQNAAIRDLAALLSSRDISIQSLAATIAERDELIAFLRSSNEQPVESGLHAHGRDGGWPVNANSSYEDIYVLDVDLDAARGDGQEPGGTTFDDLAVHLEQAFREDAHVIRQRHGRYFEHLAVATDTITFPIVDVGCGRGDFLRVATELGHRCVGVETSNTYVDALAAEGLQAIHADGVTFLENAGGATFGGVAALQVVEHWNMDYLERFLRAARRGLVPGGFLLIETVNPYCLDTFRTFYLDPTHQRPVPVDLLVLLLKLNGFSVHKKIFQIPRNVPAVLAYPPDPQLHYESYAVVAYVPT